MNKKSIWYVEPRFWKIALPFAVAISAAIFASGATWWMALLLLVGLTIGCYMMRVQTNMEWEGYVPCKTCRGTGRVKETND